MKGQSTRIGLAALPVVAALVTIALLYILFQGLDTEVEAGIGEIIDAFWKGSLRNSRRLANVVEFWIPLTLVSMGLVLTFRAGLWNIGIEGQMIAGGLAATGVVFTINSDSPVVMLTAGIVAAMIGGGLWAALAGVLKTRFGVHEIFAGVALNAVANQMTLQLMAGPWKPTDSDKAQYSRPLPEAALFPGIGRSFDVSLLAIFITLAVIVIVILLLWRTRWGLNIKAVGKNPRSALLLGVPVTFSSLSAIIACGALAGIGGAHRIMFTYENVRGGFSGGIGFLGLLVVLLVGMRGIWVPFVTFIFSMILAASIQLQNLNLDTSLTGVLQGLLVLLVFLYGGLRDRLYNPDPDEVAVPSPVATESAGD